MKSLQASINLSKYGIKHTEKKKCDKCQYGTVITITTSEGTVSWCRYCENKKLVKQYNIPTTKEEKELHLIRNRAEYFTRIPKDIEHKKLNEYVAKTEEQKQAKQIAVDYIVNFDKEDGSSLVLSGEPGVGKSHIAVSIANALKDKHTVLFLKSTNLLDFIKESYSGEKYTEADVLDTCAKVDLLVLDDLGAEYAKASEHESWASDIIFKVLDSRLGKSTVITTNYNESGLEEKYGFNGRRITSRMSDNATKIRIVGEDGRRTS